MTTIKLDNIYSICEEQYDVEAVLNGINIKLTIYHTYKTTLQGKQKHTN